MNRLCVVISLLIVSTAAARVDVTQYATAGSGTHGNPWVNALAEAYRVNGVHQQYYLPSGYYEDSRTIELAGPGYIDIVGDGATSTVLRYAGADGTSLLKIHNHGEVCFLVAIRDIWFHGKDLATGAALEIQDGSKIHVERCFFSRWSSPTAKALWIRGREQMTFNNLYMVDVTTGIHLDHNPNFAGIDVDHCHISDCYFGCGDLDNGCGVRVDADDVFSLSTSGFISVTRARYGFRWNCASPFGDSQDILLQGWRVEKGDTTNADCWGFHVATDVPNRIRNLQFSNCSVSTGVNGWYIRGATGVSFHNCQSRAHAGYTSFDIGAEVGPCLLWNVAKDDEARFSIAGTPQLRIFSPHKEDIGYYDDGSLLRTGMSWQGHAISEMLVKPPIATIPVLNTDYFKLRVVDADGFAVVTSGAPIVGHVITIDVHNDSGGAMGLITWPRSFKMAGLFETPAEGKHRTLTLMFDGGAWRELSRSNADIDD